MWIFVSDAYLSIVDKSKKPNHLMVRSRDRDHILAVFPNAKVRNTPRVDYQYRADIPRAEVASVVAERVMAIDYDNFKNKIMDNSLHDVCSRIWSVCLSLGPDRLPFSYGGSWFDDK